MLRVRPAVDSSSFDDHLSRDRWMMRRLSFAVTFATLVAMTGLGLTHASAAPTDPHPRATLAAAVPVATIQTFADAGLQGETVAPIELDLPALFTDAADHVQRSVDECGCGLGTPDAANHVYGTAVIRAIDSVIAGTAVPDLAALYSGLFGSGYFGGLFLKAGLSGDGNGALLATPIARFAQSAGVTTARLIEEAIQSLSGLAVAGSDSAVRQAAQIWLPILSAIGGYNNGYVAVALAHPPGGAPGGPPSQVVVCEGTFRCLSPSFPMTADTVLEPGRQQLLAGNDPASVQLRRLTVGVEKAAYSSGAGVWQAILSGQDFGAATYDTIIDLSIGFLKVVHGSILALAGGLLRGDMNLVRRGLLSTASLVTWAGSYFVGLASPQPPAGTPGVPPAPQG